MRIIAGEARGRTIDAPSGMKTRPTLDRVRENLFNMIQTDVRDCTVLDLFAGSGALSLEAISRGASTAVLVDNDRNAHLCQKKNIDRLHYNDKAVVLLCDWQKALSQLQTKNYRFDLVFLDPPYVHTDLRDVFSGILPLIHPEALIVVEHEANKEVIADSRFFCYKQRSWGFCAVSLFRLSEPSKECEVI